MTANFRERLRRGELLVGTLITIGSSTVAEVVAAAGFDWLFLDAEHGPLDPGILLTILQAVGKETPCLIRVSCLEEGAFKKALDLGPAGIIVPMVNTAEQARKAVQWSHFPPEGARSLGAARANGYGFRLQEYLGSVHRELALVVQAESAEAVRNIREIVRVEGIAGVFVGPYDLAGSMGHPADPGHPEVRAAIERIAEACREASMPLGIFGMTPEALKPHIEKGFTLIAAGLDAGLLGNAARQMVGALRR